MVEFRSISATSPRLVLKYGTMTIGGTQLMLLAINGVYAAIIDGASSGNGGGENRSNTSLATLLSL